MENIYKQYRTLIIIIIAIPFISCKKFVEVSAPTTSANSEIVFSTDATAAAVMTGIYSQMNVGSMTNINGGNSLCFYPELSGDNLVLFANNNEIYTSYYRNVLSQFTVAYMTYWSQIYPLIYTTNSVIEGANKSNTLSNGVKNQLIGEAYFMRAFFYFYLINLYGEVPLVLSTTYKETAILGRTSVSNIYGQITDDLIKSQNLLSESYMDASLSKVTLDRLRPNKYAATALLSRVYLFRGDFMNAEIESSKIINQKAIYDIVPLANVFLKNSLETIWALQPVQIGENTQEAKVFRLPDSGPNVNNNPVYLSERLLESFELNDQRKLEWIGKVVVNGKDYSFPTKYKLYMLNQPVNEYGIVMRLAEQYLIRAEARAQQNNIVGAQDDINTIRRRSGLGNTDASDKENLLNAVLKERRVEFFTEYGHRWFDLKRTGKINEEMQIASLDKGSTWKLEAQFYPIPASEIKMNSRLIQNPGY